MVVRALPLKQSGRTDMVTYRRATVDGLEEAVRLRTALLRDLGREPRECWAAVIDGFVEQVRRSRIRGTTAELLLLLDVGEDLRILLDLAGGDGGDGPEQVSVAATDPLPVFLGEVTEYLQVQGGRA